MDVPGSNAPYSPGSALGLISMRTISHSHGGDCTAGVQPKVCKATIRVPFRRKQPQATVVPE